MNYAVEISQFYKYVSDFYNDVNGVYPIASEEKIVEAVNQYLESKSLSEIHFDSFDRECVRMILQPEYSLYL